MSRKEDGLQHQLCNAPLTHMVAAGANAPRKAQDSGLSEDIPTATVKNWAEVYTSIWENQGRPLHFRLQSYSTLMQRSLGKYTRS